MTETLTERLHQCPKCKRTYPWTIEFFGLANHQTSGVSSYCRECNKVRSRHYVATKRSENPNYDHDKYVARREQILNYHASYFNTLHGVLRHKLQGAKQRSKAIGREFTITFQHLLDLWHLQNGRCALTGIPLEHKVDYGKNPQQEQHRSGRSKEMRHPDNVSIDRIDNNLGYIPGNVRLVACSVNVALNNFGEEVFDAMCRARVKMLDK